METLQRERECKNKYIDAGSSLISFELQWHAIKHCWNIEENCIPHLKSKQMF